MSSPLFDQLFARLTGPAADHPSFRGPPVDISGLSSRELGHLWPCLQRRLHQTEDVAGLAVAQTVLAQARAQGLVPVFDQAIALECLRDLEPGALDRAIEILALLDSPPGAAFASEAHRLLDDLDWAANRLQAAVLVRLAGGSFHTQLKASVAAHFAASPYVVREFDALEDVSVPAMLAFASSPFVAYFGPHFHPDAPDPAQALSEEPAYIEFAERTLRLAAQRLADIHRGAVPYVADGAFTVDDAAVIARAARVALWRDEPWLGGILATLLPQACVAPTGAKTAPSQSLAIALGHSIQRVPTPEAVLALREALKVVRHASVERKLSRNLKPAERELADRPALALRLAVDAKADKRQTAILSTFLESGLWRDFHMPWQEWCQRLVCTPAGNALAASLIWRVVSSGVSFMVASGKSQTPRLTDAQGHDVVVPESAGVGLWHPLLAEPAERKAWQDVVAARRIHQAIRQAYREHYLPATGERDRNTSIIFSGYVLAVRPLIGLARREGWQIDK